MKISKSAFFAVGLALYIFVIGFGLKIIIYGMVTYRHPWQYEKEMATYRQYEQYVSYFPEAIPDCATNVDLKIFTGIWQAKSYINLSFTADDAYIQECKEKHMEWFYEFEDIHLDELTDLDLSALKENACVDLYPVIEKIYNQYYSPEYLKAFPTSREEGLKKIMQQVLPHNILLTEEELRSAKQYHICESLGQGFIIVEDTNRIIFYKDNEY